MSTTRHSISKKLRFEIFKRDAFKCQYCGQVAPDVVLHIDHIKPVADGGDNDISNLITACVDCNSGKGARLLGDNTTVEKQRKQLEELNERREQLQLMLQWRDGLLSIEEDKVNAAVERFEELTDCTINDNGTKTLKKLIKKYGLEEVLEAISISTTQYEDSQKAFDYISRICAIRKTTADKPYMKDLYYIRGILRNRLHYCNEQKAIALLEGVHKAGVSIDSLTAFAKEVKNWTGFCHALETIIEEEKNG